MAILIPMTKVAEDDHSVAYEGTTRRATAVAMVDKDTGETSLVSSAAESDEAADFLTSRMLRVLHLLWERGDYPTETDYRH